MQSKKIWKGYYYLGKACVQLKCTNLIAIEILLSSSFEQMRYAIYIYIYIYIYTEWALTWELLKLC